MINSRVTTAAFTATIAAVLAMSESWALKLKPHNILVAAQCRQVVAHLLDQEIVML